MRYMLMHKVDAKMEAGILPSQELIANMGKLMGSLAQAGTLVDGAGLRPSATRVRLRFTRGERTMMKGPYSGENELPSRAAMIKTATTEEAIECATRIGKILGDGEIEVGPVTEAWDLGMMPKPDGAPLRSLLLIKADAEDEAGRGAKRAASIEALFEEMAKAGTLLSRVALKPSAQAKRAKFTGGRRTIVDGPFTESKELIAGYVIFDATSFDEVLSFADRFAQIIGDTEIDLRTVDG